MNETIPNHTIHHTAVPWRTLSMCVKKIMELQVNKPTQSETHTRAAVAISSSLSSTYTGKIRGLSLKRKPNCPITFPLFHTDPTSPRHPICLTPTLSPLWEASLGRRRKTASIVHYLYRRRSILRRGVSQWRLRRNAHTHSHQMGFRFMATLYIDTDNVVFFFVLLCFTCQRWRSRFRRLWIMSHESKANSGSGGDKVSVCNKTAL